MTRIILHDAKAGAEKTARLKVFALALLASLLVSSAIPHARAAGTIKKHHKSAFRSQNGTNKRDCLGNNCTIAGPIFGSVLNMVCPDLKTTQCFYYLHLKSQVHVSAGDAGFFRFLVDGKAAALNGGGTDANGYVTWTNGDPDSGIVRWDARSYAVATTLQNTADNQTHKIDVQIGCTDTDGDGTCSVSSGLSSLAVDVESFFIQ